MSSFEALLTALRHSDPENSSAITSLVEDIRNPSWTVRETAVEAIAALPQAKLPGVLPVVGQALFRVALHDRMWLVRDTAARALAHLAPDAETAGEIAGLLIHKEPSQRRRAARALVYFPAHAARIVPALERALGDGHRKVRQAAAETLGRLGAGATPALPGLLRRLHDHESRVRRAAREAIIRISPHCPAAFQPWLDLLAAPGCQLPEILHALLQRDDLPARSTEDLRQACLRRSRWYRQHLRLPDENALPPSDLAEASQQAANLAGQLAVKGLSEKGDARQREVEAREREYGWQVARLAALLAREGSGTV